MWAISIAYIFCKRPRESNNFCILISMMGMIKILSCQSSEKGLMELSLFIEFQNSTCLPKTIALKLDSDQRLYLHVHWIDPRTISIPWAVSFSFQQHKQQPMNTRSCGKTPTRAIVGGMVGEDLASCPPWGSLARLSGNMSSGLILFSDIWSRP